MPEAITIITVTVHAPGIATDGIKPSYWVVVLVEDFHLFIYLDAAQGTEEVGVALDGIEPGRSHRAKEFGVLPELIVAALCRRMRCSYLIVLTEHGSVDTYPIGQFDDGAGCEDVGVLLLNGSRYFLIQVGQLESGRAVVADVQPPVGLPLAFCLFIEYPVTVSPRLPRHGVPRVDHVLDDPLVAEPHSVAIDPECRLAQRPQHVPVRGDGAGRHPYVEKKNAGAFLCGPDRPGHLYPFACLVARDHSKRSLSRSNPVYFLIHSGLSA